MRATLRFQVLLGICGLITMACLTGCGDQKPRYPLAGSITFRGRPVPFGRLTLIPDAPDADSQSRSIVDFNNGQYETPSDQFVFGGQYRVEIDGFRDTAAEQRMFPICSLHVKLPETGGTFDFEVPTRHGG